MEKIEKPKRASSPDARSGPPVGVRLSKAERAELQAGADLASEGNLGLYIRTLALRLHRRPPYSTVPLNDLHAEAMAQAFHVAAKMARELAGRPDQLAAELERIGAKLLEEKNPAQGGQGNVEAAKEE